MKRRPSRRVISPERLTGPLVAIVGRPNVGKSTLFNRLVGAPIAVVAPEEGTTRDRHYAGTEWEGRSFVLVDTGGFVAFDSDRMSREIQRQVLHAVEEAELVVLVVDAGTGPTDLDLALARILRKSGRPTMVMANKVDRPSDEDELHRFLQLGLGEPFPVSALHGRRTGDVLDAIASRLPPPDAQAALDEDESRVRIAVVGRPNVGKSSLVNRMVGMERMIVDDSAGTTRDAIDTRAEIDGHRITLIDTAGLRRQAKRDPGIEYWSSLRSERAIARSDIVILVIEAREAGTTQDARIADLVDEMGRGLILMVSKWDMVGPGERDREAWTTHLRREFRFVPYAPIVFASSVTGTGVGQLVPIAAKIWSERRRWLPDERVEEIMSRAVERRVPSGQGRRGVLFSARQTGVAPPLFTLHVNQPRIFEGTYLRYLQNRLRREVPFEGTPVRLDLRTGRPRPEGAGGKEGRAGRGTRRPRVESGA